MKTFLVAYLGAGVAFLAVDAVWLTVMANMLYKPLLGDKLLPSFSLAPAAVFYLIVIAALVVLAVLPAVAAGDWRLAARNGAIFGLAAYATYDLTNQATLKDWPLTITIADMIWGTVLATIAAVAGYAAASRFG